jgi:chromate transporter
MLYLKLFWSFFQIGLFSIGGGYAALPLIKHQVVEIHPWLSMTEFSDIITISQMTPGPIAINSATFVGTQIGGLPGAIIATLGCILPSCIIVLTLAYIYYKYREISMVQGILSGLRPAVVSLIASAGLSILFLAFWGSDKFPSGIKDTNYISIFIFAIAIFVLRKWKANPIHVMIGSGVIGLILYHFF